MTFVSATALADGDVVLLENVRFNPGEKADDEGLSRQYAALCDIFVMDAFDHAAGDLDAFCQGLAFGGRCHFVNQILGDEHAIDGIHTQDVRQHS